MSSLERISIASPESRGAAIISADEFRSSLDSALSKIQEKSGSLFGLILLRLKDLQGKGIDESDRLRAAHIVSQLVRQRDAVGILDDGSLAIALNRLERRGDAYVTVDRLEAFAKSVSLPWELVTGVAIYPLCGGRPSDLWAACARDLEGAMSSDTWEHYIPRDTLMTRTG